MRKKPEVDEVAARIKESIEASPKKQRRLKSKTLWVAYHIVRRTELNVPPVVESLRRHDILISLPSGADFGKEDKDDWVLLSLQVPQPPMPSPDDSIDVSTDASDEWFRLMGRRHFESELEVEFFYVIPLL